MKVLNQLPLLIFLFLFQGCLPDSFTKFKEEPAVKKEEGASGGGSPSNVSIDYDDIQLSISSQSLTVDYTFDPGINAPGFTNFTNFATFVMVGTLPEGLALNANTGAIIGTPLAPFFDLDNAGNFVEREVEVSFNNGQTQFTQRVPIRFKIDHDLRDEISIVTSNKTVVVTLDSMTPFLPTSRNVVSTTVSKTENTALNPPYKDISSSDIHVLTGAAFPFSLSNIVSVDYNNTFTTERTKTGNINIALSYNENLDAAISDRIHFMPVASPTPTAQRSFAISDDELSLMTFQIIPDLNVLNTGLYFAERSGCYNTTTGALQNNDDPCDFGFVEIKGGSIFGTAGTNKLEPTEFTVVASTLNQNESLRNVTLSIFEDTPPKGIDLLTYKQEADMKLKLPVTNVTNFSVGGKLISIGGKKAEVLAIDTPNRFLYVRVIDAAGEFDVNTPLSSGENFFTTQATINNLPVFLYNSDPIDNIVQKRMELRMGPSAVYENASTEERNITFSILPNLNFLDNGNLVFATRSACFDTTDLSLPPTDADFSLLPGDPCVSYIPARSFIRGGTIFGSLDPDMIPYPETTYTVTAVLEDGRDYEMEFAIEFLPTVQPVELSITDTLLLKLEDNTEFNEGGYISAPNGSLAVIKEKIGDKFLWVKMENGVFEDNQNVSTRKIYSGSSSFIREVHAVTAKITTDVAMGLPLTDIVVDDDQTNNVLIGNADPANRARVVYKNGADLYVRVISGTFRTGESVADSDGAISAQIENINAKRLRIVLNAAPVAGKTPAVDSNIIYSTDSSINRHHVRPDGVAEVREISGANVSVDVIRGDLGTVANSLYLNNFIEAASDADKVRTINSISVTASDIPLYSYLKDFPMTIIPYTENDDSVSSYTLSPSVLPTGLTFNATTGIISGVAKDRLAPLRYDLTATNNFGSKTVSFRLEIKDFFGIINMTENANSYILHKDGPGNNIKPCVVTRAQLNAAAIEGREINCYLDANEADLYYEGIKLSLTYGSNMCDFVQHDPFFFVRAPAGKNVAGGSQGNVDQGDISNGACIAMGANANNTLANLSDVVGKCAYEYTDLGLNCDEGEYGYTIRTFDAFNRCDAPGSDGDGLEYNANSCGECTGPGVGANLETNQADCLANDPANTWLNDETSYTTADCNVSSSAQVQSCGGDVRECIAGAGALMSTVDQLLNLGYERRLNAQNPSINSTTITIPSPSSEQLDSNRSLANYIDERDVTCRESNYKMRHTQARELEKIFVSRKNQSVLRYEDNQTGALFANHFNGNAYYTFSCLVGANARAKIRLIVRDWNVDFSASHDIDKLNPDLGDDGATQNICEDGINFFTDAKCQRMRFTGFDDDVSIGQVINQFLSLERDYRTGGTAISCDSTQVEANRLDYIFPDEDLGVIMSPSSDPVGGVNCTDGCAL